MIKPIGPVCNLNCTYCYYLHKKDLYAGQGDWRMAEPLLEKFIKEYIGSQDAEEIDFPWQGGEPTLLGIDFFRKVVELQKRYCPPTKRIQNDIQTNGTLLDEQWGRFLAENRFLAGLSIDGPQEMHDLYRRTKENQPTFDKVFAAARLLQKYQVDFNTLTVVHRLNAKKPLEVYRFLRDEVGSRYIQFIPGVEPKDFMQVAPQYWDKGRLPVVDSLQARPGAPDSVVTDWSVDPEEFGDFLIAVFDEWLRKDVGKVFIPLFEAALNRWLGQPSPVCYFAEICGRSLGFEHDGSVYSCDHYVYPEYKLGNIQERSFIEMLYSEKQVDFGLAKTDNLPEYCRQCKYLFVCNGECPKNRFLRTEQGEPGLNYLCRGLYKFFEHADPWMKRIGKEIRAGRPAANVMKITNQSVKNQAKIARPMVKLSAACPCGSGRKYKKCCYQKD